jgi:hypothetical protein
VFQIRRIIKNRALQIPPSFNLPPDAQYSKRAQVSIQFDWIRLIAHSSLLSLKLSSSFYIKWVLVLPDSWKVDTSADITEGIAGKSEYFTWAPLAIPGAPYAVNWIISMMYPMQEEIPLSIILNFSLLNVGRGMFFSCNDPISDFHVVISGPFVNVRSCYLR